MPAHPRRILLSGGTGFLGSEFLRRALRRDPGCAVLLPVRAPPGGTPGGDGALSRWETLARDLGLTPEQAARVTPFEARFSEERLGLAPARWEALCAGLTDVVHAAAEVRFDQSLEQARASNLATTERMLGLTPAGATFHHVSTFALTRPAPGETVAREVRVDPGVPFRNLYEQTKAEAEVAVNRAVAAGLRARIYRTSILAGDSRTGWTSKFDGLYALARLLVLGAELGVKEFPIPTEARLEVLTVDSVAEALAALVLEDPVQVSGEVLHLTSGEGSPRLLEASAPLFSALRRISSGLPGGEVQLPAFVDAGNLSLQEARQEFERRVPADAVETVRPWADALLPYALDTAQYDNARALERLELLGVLLLRADTCADSLAGFCLRTQWGAVEEPRPPASLRLLERAEEDPVVVVGAGALLPGASSVEAFRALMDSGACALGPVPASRWDATVFGAGPGEDAEDRTRCTLGGFITELPFDGREFRVTPVTAASMDRLHKLTLLAAREALGQVGLEKLPQDRARVGCVLGHSGVYLENAYRFGLRVAHRLFSSAAEETFGAGARKPEVTQALDEALRGGTPAIGEDTLAGSLANVAAGRVMNAFDLHGPNWVVNAGNGSSLAALEQAADLLRTGECDLVLAGGANAVMDPVAYANLEAQGLLSPEPPRPFTPEARGTVPGEGAVMFAVCRLSYARAHGLQPLAAVRGVGRAGNGHTALAGMASMEALRLSRARAVDQAGEALDGLEVGALGLPGADALEHAFVETEFPLGRPRLGAAVAQVGHLAGASSAVALLRAMLQVHSGRWLGEPLPGGAGRSTSPRRVGINAFGAGGAAYHVVVGALSEAELRGPAPRPAPPCAPVPVALVALGAFLPGAPDVRSARELLAAGAPQAAPLPSHLWEGHKEAFFSADPDAAEDTSHGELGVLAGPLPAALPAFLEQVGIPPSVSARMDDNHLHLLEATRQVVEDARWTRVAPERMGVVLGESTSSMRGAWRLEKRMAFLALEAALRRVQGALAPGLDGRAFTAKLAGLKARLLSDAPPIDEDAGPGILVPLTAERISQFVDARGGGAALDAACASSLAALLCAVRDLRLGKLDAVLGAGVGLTVGPVANILFSRCMALSARWSRPFDASADGILLGEGCVGFVLKRLEDAQRDGDPVLAVIEGVGASSDGRGTAIMAPSAEGQGRAVRAALANAGLGPSDVDWVECHATGTPVGDDAEIRSIVAGYQTAARARPFPVGSSKAVWGHTVGAAGAVGLLKVVTALRAGAIPPTVLPTGESPYLELKARNLVVPQAEMPWRPAPGRVRRAGLSSFGFGGTNWHVVLREPPPSPSAGWCFVFPGHGSPYPGMGRVLYEQSAAFRAAISEANETLAPLLGRTFEQFVYGGTEEAQGRALYATESVQPLILACNVAFYRAARELGLKPAWVMGHSVGEFSAAVAAGMVSLADGLRLAHARGRIYRGLRDAGEDTGAMLAVLAGAAEVRRALEPFPDGVGLAALNSPGQVVLSGPTHGVALAAEQLAARGLSALPLPVEVAWHSGLAHAQGAERLREALAGVAFQPPRVPLIRCAGAELLPAGAPLAASYPEGYVRQLRDPVEFARMAEVAWAAGARRFLELGPRATLSGFLRDIFSGRRAEVVASDVPKRPGHEGLMRAVAADGVRHGG